ncbi:MAG: hypothetical protein D3925_14625, partial [Candidatus Electrothrix sp. AR5]|nr:hypothetical protein [Candidatus Electrothrix sp. AR5]
KTKELLETLEEVGLTNAIAEGRNDDFIEEDQIFSIFAAYCYYFLLTHRYKISDYGQPALVSGFLSLY